jgi:sugar (pentulose or hexulose) kinase
VHLGLDLGTTNIKGLLVESSGDIVARSHVRVPVYHVEQHGVEQDIEEIWQSTLTAIARLGEKTDLSSVEGIGVSSQGGALQLLDESGCPRGRVISWLDGQAAEHNQRLQDSLGTEWLADHVGHGFSAVALGQLEKLRRESPEVIRHPNQIGFVGDVIVSRLCGRRAHDTTSLSIAVLLNPSREAADPDVLDLLGVKEEQLPLLTPPSQQAGGLLSKVAEGTGIPSEVPVSVAVHDQYASALGLGAIHPGDVMVGTGTAWVLLAVADRLSHPVTASAFACPHLIKGVYGQLLSLTNGGSSLAWARDVLGLAGIDDREMDRMIATAAAGAEGLRFWPFLVAGAATQLPQDIAGRLSGLRLSHGRSHILRAVVEGLAMELARHLELIGGEGVPVSRVLLCGGASQSTVTPQVISDTTGLPLLYSAESETSALGATMIARCLVEGGGDLARTSAEMSPAKDEIAPGDRGPLYRGLLDEYIDSLPLAESDREEP